MTRASKLRHCGELRLTGQHDESWRESTGRARPRACCGDHTRRRASAQYPYPNINQCPRHKRSTLSLSGRGVAHTDERTRKDDGGRCTSWSRSGRPFLLVDGRGEVVENGGNFGVAKSSCGPRAPSGRYSLSDAVWEPAQYSTHQPHHQPARTNNTALTHTQWVTQPVSARVRAMRTFRIIGMGVRRLLTRRQLLEGLQEEGYDPAIDLSQAVQGRRHRRCRSQRYEPPKHREIACGGLMNNRCGPEGYAL